MGSGGNHESDPRQRRLGDAFFRGGAAVHREHLALRAEEIAARDLIAEATGITDEHLLAELAALGITVETLTALALIPLIDVAWADGEMDEAERASILRGAISAGIASDSIGYRLLELWMEEEQAPDLTQLWGEFTSALCRELPAERVERLERSVLGRARKVAEAAGDARDRRPHVSAVEEARLEELAQAFHPRRTRH